MTKRRAPVTQEQALARICGEIGYDRAAELVGRSPRTVYKWTDPDAAEELSFRAAVLLDAAMKAATGETPLAATYALLLDACAADACTDQRQLVAHAANAARETGEALSSLFIAAGPGACDASRLVAARDVEEAMAALSVTLPHLTLEKPRAPTAKPAGPEVPAPGRGEAG